MVTYKIVPDFFIQDTRRESEPAEPAPPFFGLHSQSWSKFSEDVKALQDACTDGSQVKVLYMGRHGQGWHNVAEAKYRTMAWEDHWALLDGDGEMVWGPDPHLTALGEQQARDANAAWKREVAQGLPMPEGYYCSPMRRALRTFVMTFDGIVETRDAKPMVLEVAREHYGRHTCDKRSPLSQIQAEFPLHTFEEGFSEEDVLWTDERESYEHVTERAKQLLDIVFTDNPDKTYISLTGHNGIFNGILRAIGRGNYALPTGGIFVAVIKRTP
ncbi:phosphoglycerate mutase [Peniophora sp. CONT]|nr:phosphoglycerate mutase [Peniophora sp. CONT]